MLAASVKPAGRSCGRSYQGGGDPVAIGDGANTARELFDLPGRDATPTNRDQFNVPRTLVRNGYDQQALAGLANVVSFDVGQGHVTTGGENTFRSWLRSAFPILYNSIYHGPSEPADAPRFG
ncbi:hypothetical protein GCM10027290_12060 [Micromonospora sonneratiae]|uniref:Uncharacterized protein n=1 Tax=Micromonospora sonneratiae TaxID=1184706 RepID=A0ABW3YEV7_9ACTN